MRRLWLLLLVPGCSLYFGHSGDDHPGPGPDPEPPDSAQGEADLLARPCIRAAAVGSFLLGGSDDVFLTYVCDANGAGAIIEYDSLTPTDVAPGTAHADFQQPFVRLRVTPWQGAAEQVIAFNEFDPGGWILGANGGSSWGTTRATTDAFFMPGTYDTMYYVGDQAIHTEHFPAWDPGDPPADLAVGKPFRYATGGAFGGTSGKDIFYVTGAAGEPHELGTLVRQADGTYAQGPTESLPAGAVAPLAVADVDGDGVADVVGLATKVFVRSSRTGTISYLDGSATMVTTGDFDGDHVSEVAYLTGDRSAIRRATMASDGTLTSMLLVTYGGDDFAVGDLDHNGHADLAIIRDRGQQSSTLKFLRNPL
ncbi:MAG: hypothetical protein ABI678_27835 [Kofleriaceae bacterium]